MIQLIAEDVGMPLIDEAKLSSWVARVVAGFSKKTGRINYTFCTDKRILEVNQQFLNHDYYTDIISFDYSRGVVVAGDIFISVETVASNAEKLRLNFLEELHRVMIHGVLHFCGMNDVTATEEAAMRKAENDALELLKV